MRRTTFSNGLFPHQAEVAIWARRRLIDRGGCWFDTGRRGVDQYGVVAADGVGLGKTWEALAASALILVERGKERTGGGRRRNVRKQPARVLVLCPPGLVSKWSREVRDPDGFSARLHEWAASDTRRRFVLKTLTEPYEIRRRTDLPRGRVRRERLTLPPGTYICNWNVLRKNVGSGRSRLAALRGQSWDVVIVDEAHHREAREAIDTVWRWAPGADRMRILLLTATPFQLDPRELHDLLGGILDGRHGEHRVLARPPVRPFVTALTEFFEGGKAPQRGTRREAERILRQVIARSDMRPGSRKYFVLDREGSPTLIPAPDQLREEQLRELLSTLVTPTPKFETWYLERRLRLAGEERTVVSEKLRQALSTPGQAKSSRLGKPPASPRLDALLAWARNRVAHDLLETARDGLPRKVLVFTRFVRSAARELHDALGDTVNAAWKDVRQHARWRRLARDAAHGVGLVSLAATRFIKGNEFLSDSSDAWGLVEALQAFADLGRSSPAP